MDLYDDIDTKPRASQMDGWSSGIKMLQTQLAIKKAAQPQKETKKPLLPPVVNLRKKIIKDDVKASPASNKQSELGGGGGGSFLHHQKPIIITAKPLEPVLDNVKSEDWDFVDEYDPHWPNEYEKLKDKQKSHDIKPPREERSRNNDKKRNNRNSSSAPPSHIDSPKPKVSGFAQRPPADEDTYSPPHQLSSSSSGSANKGATIAPPPSLQEISINNDNGDASSNVTIPYTASSVAAKIMAKYGFKDGSGLGKQEQGMSMALQVEKTSKRGGRIIHEKDVFLPPPPAGSTASLASSAESSAEPSITEIMKQPSKVVLLRNMVGPGDVDDELEPEVKDECNTKYGEVGSVIIHEAFGTTPEEAVKIYVEFKRIESAIKAVVDLNGRFFGGRQVRAGFFDFHKFKNLDFS